MKAAPFFSRSIRVYPDQSCGDNTTIVRPESAS